MYGRSATEYIYEAQGLIFCNQRTYQGLKRTRVWREAGERPLHGDGHSSSTFWKQFVSQHHSQEDIPTNVEHGATSRPLPPPPYYPKMIEDDGYDFSTDEGEVEEPSNSQGTEPTWLSGKRSRPGDDDGGSKRARTVDPMDLDTQAATAPANPPPVPQAAPANLTGRATNSPCSRPPQPASPAIHPPGHAGLLVLSHAFRE